MSMRNVGRKWRDALRGAFILIGSVCGSVDRSSSRYDREYLDNQGDKTPCAPCQVR
jgi:hypothetical protein